MVEGVTAGGQVGLVALTAVRYAQPDAPGVVMPVRRAQMVYASFKHIQVCPDSSLKDGVPLYKLRILDTLIDQLSRAGAAGGERGRSGMRAEGASIDGLITGMAKLLLPAGTAGDAYLPGFLPEPGAFVDLAA